MRYACYQLVIDSAIELPELHAASDDSAAIDVTFVRASLREDGSACGEQRGPYLWMGPGKMWLRVPGVARYQVEDGRRILFDADPGVDDASVRLFLLGSAIGALLAQRGLMVLHGNAVRVANGAMVCVGPSGAGKSTLAAALMQRGHEVIADDVVAIDAQGDVLPGLPRIKLWNDAAQHLSVATEGLARIRPGFDKFSLPMAATDSAPPASLRSLYVLGSHREDVVTVTPLRGIETFKVLQENLYRARILRAMSPLPEHLALCGRLAREARIARVQRPERGFAMDALVEALLQDAAGSA